MMRSLRYAGAVALMVLGTAPLTPQGPVIRVTVDLVQLDAAVTDSKGRHVADLKPGEFQILEDGKRQKITHFSYVQGVTQAAPAQSVNGSRVGAAIAPTKPLSPEQVHRTIVMIADDLGLSPDDIPNVRKAMKSFVESQMQPGDLVSIMTTSGGMGAMQQLTNDKRQLQASIDRIHYLPGRTGLSWYAPIRPGPDGALEMDIAKRIGAARSPFLTAGTMSVMAHAIQGLSEMPGRKAVALFSDGFPPAAGGIVQLANRASVVVYTLDPRGFQSFRGSALDGGIAGGTLRWAREREAVFRETQKGLDQLARGTGGIFFHDSNDLAQGLASALDDMGSYYLIGYQPQRTDFDQVRGAPQFHKIEVKVLRSGLEVRSRNGFVGVPDPAATAEATSPKSGKEELRKALFSPFHANGFPVHLSALYSASADKDPKTGRRVSMLRAMLAIDARSLRFNDTADGGKQLNLEIVAAADGPNNEVVASSDRTFSPVMTAEEMNQILASGLAYGFEIEIPKPGPYQLRVAAWDANSEQVGSAATFVEIPDYNGAGIALSSVQLHDSDSKRNEELTRAGVLGAGSPVTRVFASGAVLEYDCAVYGPLVDQQTGKPKLDVTVRLFRGPEQIFRGQPIDLAIAGGNSTGAIRAAGEIKLPATLPRGDYALELNVHDRLQKKQSQGVAQWVDFTLMK
jgi:VWFA-related protein